MQLTPFMSNFTRSWNSDLKSDDNQRDICFFDCLIIIYYRKYLMLQTVCPLAFENVVATERFENESTTSNNSSSDNGGTSEFGGKTLGKLNSKIKSSLCRNYMEFGSCQYGSKCQFAHGLSELRCNADNQMSYKTRTCHSFDKKSFCFYGKRCNFIHGSEEDFGK